MPTDRQALKAFRDVLDAVKSNDEDARDTLLIYSALVALTRAVEALNPNKDTHPNDYSYSAR